MSPPAPLSMKESAGEGNRLAEDRTIMAADRSLMAWVRTALSMISFGFTIYKLLDGLKGSGIAVHANSPRNMGLFLTGMGTLAMVMGTVEYWVRLQELRAYRAFSTWRPSFVMALVMSLVGLFTFVSIVAKVL